MSRILTIAILVIVVIGAGAAYFVNHGNLPSPLAQQHASSTTGLANPASVNCATLGGTLEIKDAAGGAVGICHLPDGRACEEWGLFRGTGCTDPTASTTDPRFVGPDGSYIADNITLGTDATTTLGTHLVGWTGMTLYTFSKDQAGTTTCYGTCATNWPPYVVPQGMHLNLQAGVVGTSSTLVRAGGDTQVTYKGKPLYYYIGDKSAGDTTGQGVGGVWFVVKP